MVDKRLFFDVYTFDGIGGAWPVEVGPTPPEDWFRDWEWVAEQTGFSLDAHDSIEVGLLNRQVDQHQKGAIVIVERRSGRLAIAKEPEQVAGAVVIKLRPEDLPPGLVQMLRGERDDAEAVHQGLHKLAKAVAELTLRYAFPGLSEEQVGARIPERDSVPWRVWMLKMNQEIHDLLDELGMDYVEVPGGEPLNLDELRN